MAGKKKFKGKALRPKKPAQTRNGGGVNNNGGAGQWKVEDQVLVRFNEEFGSEDFEKAASQAWTTESQASQTSSSPAEIIPGL